MIVAAALLVPATAVAQSGAGSGSYGNGVDRYAQQLNADMRAAEAQQKEQQDNTKWILIGLAVFALLGGGGFFFYEEG